PLKSMGASRTTPGPEATIEAITNACRPSWYASLLVLTVPPIAFMPSLTRRWVWPWTSSMLHASWFGPKQARSTVEETPSSSHPTEASRMLSAVSCDQSGLTSLTWLAAPAAAHQCSPKALQGSMPVEWPDELGAL